MLSITTALRHWIEAGPDSSGPQVWTFGKKPPTLRSGILMMPGPAMARPCNTKSSKLVKKQDSNKKKSSQLKKTTKPAKKIIAPIKAMRGKRIKSLTKERHLKRKTEPKTPIPVRSLLPEAAAAPMNLGRTGILFQNPEALTSNQFSMTL